MVTVSEHAHHTLICWVEVYWSHFQRKNWKKCKIRTALAKKKQKQKQKQKMEEFKMPASGG